MPMHSGMQAHRRTGAQAHRRTGADAPARMLYARISTCACSGTCRAAGSEPAMQVGLHLTQAGVREAARPHARTHTHRSTHTYPLAQRWHTIVQIGVASRASTHPHASVHAHTQPCMQARKPSANPASKQASQKASQPASKGASKPARKQATTPASKQDCGHTQASTKAILRAGA